MAIAIKSVDKQLLPQAGSGGWDFSTSGMDTTINTPCLSVQIVDIQSLVAVPRPLFINYNQAINHREV